jgi:steroid 5-alpha reductase family enzyme
LGQALAVSRAARVCCGGMKKSIRDSRSLGVLTSAITYLAAMVVAVAVVRAAELGHPLADLALGTGVATAVVFAVSVAADNSSIYDPYWSVQPMAIAGYYLWVGRERIDARQIVVAVLVLLYASRLTSNFYRSWTGLRKEDFRYVRFRERFGAAYWPVSFLGIHLFPTLMVYLGCLPLYAVTRPETSNLRWLDGVSMALTLGAIALALAADEQLRRFRKDPRNKDRVLTGGLWSRSRHPNYLGEIATWWGLWLFALSAGLKWWWTVCGAAAITAMFALVSIPIMERRVAATRGGYEEYRRRTPMLLPRLGR